MYCIYLVSLSLLGGRSYKYEIHSPYHTQNTLHVYTSGYNKQEQVYEC